MRGVTVYCRDVGLMECRVVAGLERKGWFCLEACGRD